MGQNYFKSVSAGTCFRSAFKSESVFCFVLQACDVVTRAAFAKWCWTPSSSFTHISRAQNTKTSECGFTVLNDIPLFQIFPRDCSLDSQGDVIEYSSRNKNRNETKIEIKLNFLLLIEHICVLTNQTAVYDIDKMSFNGIAVYKKNKGHSKMMIKYIKYNYNIIL